MFLFVCFFFKLKTAYEMRISDWSSDVCSSDLIGTPAIEVYRILNIGGKIENESARIGLIDAVDAQNTYCTGAISTEAKFLCFLRQHCFGSVGGRSEEHTSELQSLMRISYAVFCLKKKNNIRIVHIA